MNRAINKSIAFAGLIFLVSGCVPEEVPVGRMPPTLELGKSAPDFEYRSFFEEQGVMQHFSQQKGKVVYLDFWASWCKPCLLSMPLLDELRAELKNKGFEVIAVNLDENPELGLEFLFKHPVTYPVIRVPDGTISDLYEVYGLPTSYLIDRQGILRFVHQGFKEEDMEKIRQQIESLL